ncbi:MAG: metallophosphoesterase family protein [Saprospiraceae bacterium]
MSRMSFAGKVKNRVKEAVKFISDFEETAIQMAKEQGYQYVICGHIHKPQVRQEGEVTYLNSGDWVENLTALEYQFGKWKLFTYDETEFGLDNPKLNVHEDDFEEMEAILKKEILLQNLLKTN